MTSMADIQLVGMFTRDVPAGDSIESAQHTLSQINDFKRQLKFDEDEYSEIDKLFEIQRDLEICNNCNKIEENCSCGNPDYEPAYRIDLHRVVEDWIETVRSTSEVIVQISLEAMDEEPWVVQAETNNSESIELKLFFTDKLLREHKFDPYSLKFPVGFTGTSYPVNEQYVLSWGELIHDDFDQAFRSKISTLQEPITMPIVDYESGVVSEYRDEILQASEEFFKKRGHTPKDEVEKEIRSAGNIIDISSVDLVVLSDSWISKLLVCHCPHKSDRWHLHNYSTDEMAPVSDLAIANDFKSGLRHRIGTFKKIQENKKTVGTAAKVLIPVLAVLSLSPIVEALRISGFPIQQNNNLLAITKGILVTLVTIIILYIVTAPYWKSYKFDWEISEDDVKGVSDGRLRRTIGRLSNSGLRIVRNRF